MQTNERLLAETVEAWVREHLAGDSEAEKRAVGIALHAYRNGSSVAVARSRADAFLRSWSSHPANRKVRSHALVKLAS